MASLCPLRRLTCPLRIEREQQPIQYHKGAVGAGRVFCLLAGGNQSPCRAVLCDGNHSMFLNYSTFRRISSFTPAGYGAIAGTIGSRNNSTETRSLRPWSDQPSVESRLRDALTFLPPPHPLTDRGHRENFSHSSYCRMAQNFRNER